jgi:adenylate kinase
LDTFLEEKSMQLHATIALEVDETALVQRLLQRGEDSGRPDDQDEQKIRNRFAEYNKKTAPLIDYYKAHNKFHSIYGEGSIEEISAQLVSKLNTI